MKRLTFSLLCLALLAVGGVWAQDGGDTRELSLYLKSGDILTGTVKKVDEDGVKLDIGDGVDLFIRWGYTRGDKHYDLRKSATDFSKLNSVLRLADFCHEFALDKHEVEALKTALKLDPNNKEAAQRLKALPGGDTADTTKPESKPDKPEPEPKDPDTKLPPPSHSPWVVFVKMKSDDNATKTWMVEHFEQMNYSIGTEKDCEMVVELDIKLTLQRNPKFMGAELYAVYDGKLSYKLYKKGESDPFASDDVKVEGVRKDNRDEARTSCRKQLCQDAFKKLYAELEAKR